MTTPTEQEIAKAREIGQSILRSLIESYTLSLPPSRDAESLEIISSHLAAVLAAHAAEVRDEEDGGCLRCDRDELLTRWGKYNEYVSHAPDAHTAGMGCRLEAYHRATTLYAVIASRDKTIAALAAHLFAALRAGSGG